MGFFKDFQSIVKSMFWALKLSFDVDILVFRPIFPKIWRNLIQLSGHTEPRLFFLPKIEEGFGIEIFVS